MIYHVFANRSNIGDWISAKGIQTILKFTKITECLCDKPYIDETIRHLSRATKGDMIIIGGGGLFMDYFVPFWNAFNQIESKSTLILWGIGFCDIKYKKSVPPLRILEQVIKQANICVLRDELSRSYFKNLDLPDPIICPSINYIKVVSGNKNLLLHVVNYTTVGAHGYNIMCRHANKFASDTGMIYRETNNLIHNGSEKELLNTLELYRNAAIIISSALHGCIIGAAIGKKIIAVSGDYKIEGFMKLIGLQHWVLDSTKANNLPELLDKIHLQKNPSSILNDMRKRNASLSKVIRTISKNI